MKTAAVLAAGLVLAGLLPCAAEVRRGDERLFEDQPTLPESNNGTVRPSEAPTPARIDRLRDVFVALQSCWRRPIGTAMSGAEITIRVSFRRSGEVLGEPRITFYRPGQGAAEGREAFVASVRGAFARCTPLPFTPRFGAAIAGRPFTFRFVDSQAL